MQRQLSISVKSLSARVFQTSESKNDDKSLYVESQSALYDDYQQAWRYLGFYVDCQSVQNYYNYNSEGESCQRYLLWAAYVDLEYEGGGTGEYSFYNSTSNIYDESRTCDRSGGMRCARMDCHEVDTTHWKLLGIFKQAYYASKYFEQLFKHEASCIWDSSTTEFMRTYTESWPQGCKQTSYASKSGEQLYLDLKPTYGGQMAFGLYTDDICKTELAESESAGKLKPAVLEFGYLYGVYLEKWNQNLATFSYCQPCMQYTFSNMYYRRNLGEDYNMYACTDYNGNTNINQCMKFRTQTDMKAATIQDLQLADQQGGILEVKVRGRKYGSSVKRYQYRNSLPTNKKEKTAEDAYPFFVFSICVLVFGFISCAYMIRWKAKRGAERRQRQTLKEPLMQDDE